MSAEILGIIGGSGLNRLSAASTSVSRVTTPYGPPSAVPQRGIVAGAEVVFLARHGQPHTIAPHRVNYRANLWLLRELGVSAVIATNAVGGIDRKLAPGDLVVPHQIVDYTWGREHTYHDGADNTLAHVDFTRPYDTELCADLVAAGAPMPVHDGGVYGCTQGPRLESAAEIDRMERDGCTLVGMTGMPEAALARELGMPYASVCLVVNAAAGRGDGPITETSIREAMRAGAEKLDVLLLRLVERLHGRREVGR